MADKTVNDYSSFAFLLKGMQPSDRAVKSTNPNVSYDGWVDRFGAWYIQEMTVSGTTIAWRFIKGASGYSTNWALRETFSYELWDVAFA